MLRTNKCNKCLYCEKDSQIDMGCTMDICMLAEYNKGFYSGLMCQDWKAKRKNEKVVNGCPFFKAMPTKKKILSITEKAKFLLWYEENNND